MTWSGSVVRGGGLCNLTFKFHEMFMLLPLFLFSYYYIGILTLKCCLVLAGREIARGEKAGANKAEGAQRGPSVHDGASAAGRQLLWAPGQRPL